MNESRLRRSAGSLLVAEGLLGACLGFCPLALGTVQWWSLGVMAVLSGSAALAAVLARPRRLPWPVFAAFAVAGLVGLQAVPLPPAILHALSWRAADLFDFYTAGKVWHALSLDPPATARELVRLLTYAAAFLAASRVATDSGATRRLLFVIGLVCAAECLLVVAHKVLGTNQIFGLVPVTVPGAVLGTFGNMNHFAGYLTVCVPVAAMLAMSERDRAVRYTWWAVAASAATLVVLTGSRSGLLGLIAAMVVLGARMRPHGDEARQWLIGVMLCIAGGAGAVVMMLAEPQRRLKLLTLVQPSRLATDVKVRAWLDVPALVRDYWLTGVGRGAFAAAFPAYKRIPDQLTFTHVECGPLQALADLGVIAGSLLIALWIAALVLAARRKGMRERAAAVAALAGITIHELGDFSLETAGGVGLTVAVLWGVALCAEEPLGEGRHASARRGPLGGLSAIAISGRVVAMLVATGVAAGAFGFAYRHDLDRNIARLQSLAQSQPEEVEPFVRTAMVQHPAEPWFPFMAGVDLLRRKQPGQAMRYLNRALTLGPTAWKPHRAIADALWMAGRKDQSLFEYRLSYIGSGYSHEVVRVLCKHAGVDWAHGLAVFAGDDPPLLEALSVTLENLYRDDDAIAAARHLVELRPADLNAHRLLARAATRQRQWEEVLAQTVDLPATDAEAISLRIGALDQLGRSDEGDAFLAASNKAAPSPILALLLVERQLGHQHLEGALETIDAIHQDTLETIELAKLHRLRGRVLEARGRVRDAIFELLAAKRILPGEDILLELGAAYERQGLLRDAFLAYREAAQSTRTPSAETTARLARVQAVMGTSPVINGGGGGNSQMPEILENITGGGGGEAAEEE